MTIMAYLSYILAEVSLSLYIYINIYQLCIGIIYCMNNLLNTNYVLSCTQLPASFAIFLIVS